MGHDTCAFTSETVTVVFRVSSARTMLTKVIGGMETTCTKFLYTKDSSFIFQLFVSQVLLCDTVVFGAMQLFSWTLRCLCPLLDVILMFLSLGCSGVHVTLWMFLYSSQNITPVDVTLPILWHMYLNKEDIFCDPSLSFLPSLTYHPSPLGWMASGRSKSCLMVFGVGGFSSDRCSLAGRCITDSRRSLVPSPTYPAWLSRLTWIS